ncbi:MAG: DNA adenine methylase [Planctomycetes bacterium]|nr:DNA adenine methylase [Planctomycetota bacterium]
MIKYIGSKRLLVPRILQIVRAIPSVHTVVDLFAGTSRVGHALKGAGYRVLANDHNAYAETLARCYVQADAEDVLPAAQALLPELAALPGEPGHFTATWCERSRFLHPKNGARIEAIRNSIAARGLPIELEAVLLTALLEAADRVDSTTGVQMAYLKQWAPRSLEELELRLPNVMPQAEHGKGEAHRLDALEAARTLHGDVLYLDPPYNQHNYLGNYHVWESLVRWDRPDVYGIACKRVDCQQRRSPFNSKRRIAASLQAVLQATTAEHVLVSFNNEGYVDKLTMLTMLGALWGGSAHVYTIPSRYRRYVGARIGIYNHKGEKVGKVSHLQNVEYLFVASRRDLSRELAPLLDRRRRSKLDRAAAAAAE